MNSKWVRRPVTISVVAVMMVFFIIGLPIWLPVAFLYNVARRRWRFPSVRFGLFGLCWSVFEIIGVLGSGILWVVGQGKNIEAHYWLQRWWTLRLIRALHYTVGLQISVEGLDTLTQGPYVALCRHASLADSIVSCYVTGNLAHLRPRYVLKKELAMVPCLDLFGHRIPNYFLDRTSSNVAAELQGIEQLSTNLASRDVAIIFPEGTRANSDKRAKFLEQMKARAPERAARLAALQHLLPPKPAGAAALIAHVPEAKILMIWHVGFDGLDTFKGILKSLGSTRARARVVVSEHLGSSVGTGDEFVAWLDEQWLAMDAAVHRALSISAV